ncbi:asparagine synthase-related protein [Thauera humireducens]|uniref:asparagine synthase-related protein n=1 Tax=Thauera humireducens TaxID=1134435 RepID=UPI003C70F2E0
MCQLARKHVPVSLSGDGGDESFGGYRRYRMHLMEEKMRSALPLGLERQPMFGLLGRVYPKADWAPRVFRAKTTFQAMARDATEAYFHSVSIFAWRHAAQAVQCRLPQQARRLRRARRLPSSCGECRHRRSAGADPVPRPQDLPGRRHQHQGRPRQHGAHSLEVREPLMDHKLVEWLATLPSPASRSRATRASTCSRRRWSPSCPTTCSPAEDGLRRSAGALVPRSAQAARA